MKDTIALVLTSRQGGNGDPNSGSAILVEFTRAINKLRESGWKPKRNIVLGSWDAEEYVISRYSLAQSLT